MFAFDRNFITSPNHGEVLLCYVQQLHHAQRFTDVIIQCEGVIVDCCHRLVLGAFSRHFESALAGVDGSSQITLDIDPKVTGVQVEDLRLVFEYMYTGRVTQTESLFKTAKALGITTLSNLIIKRSNLPEGSELISDDHAEFLSLQCRRYYQENKFTDVAIHCEGVFMRNCHRVLLSAYSDHFEAALSNTEACPFVTLDIDSEITGVSNMDLRIIVDFMYYGIVRSPKGRAKQLIIAGRSLGVSRLCDLIISSDLASAGSNRVAQQTIVDGVFNAPGVDNGDAAAAARRQAMGADSSAGGGGGGEDSYEGANGPNDDDDSSTFADDIYDEYVMGPRRRKNPMGTYRGQMRIKSVNEPKRPRSSAGLFGDGLGPYYDDNGFPGSSYGDPSGNGDVVNEEEVSSVTLSLTAPLSKRRRSYYLDAYGYGLPEIVGGTDVTVSLLVGDQRLMMEKPFKCPYCDHRTKEKSALEKHVRCIHTLEAPYKCRYCQQSFKVQSNLVRHIRAHTGEKPYICKKCGAAYADKKNMDAHVFREHLKMRPLECPTNGCSAKFWRQDRFNYHCRRQHGLEPPEDGAEVA